MTDLLDTLLTSFIPTVVSSKPLSRVFARTYCPPITKVIDNNPTTVVFFNDGSKAKVKCFETDTYNLETAILYAIVKRTFGEVDPATNEANCPGLGNILKKIVKELTVSATLPKTKKSSKISKKLEDDTQSFSTAKEIFKYFPETKTLSKISSKLKSSPTYVRPNKPFSQFTQEEKRAYWRFQNSKRKSRQK